MAEYPYKVYGIRLGSGRREANLTVYVASEENRKTFDAGGCLCDGFLEILYRVW